MIILIIRMLLILFKIIMKGYSVRNRCNNPPYSTGIARHAMTSVQYRQHPPSPPHPSIRHFVYMFTVNSRYDTLFCYTDAMYCSLNLLTQILLVIVTVEIAIIDHTYTVRQLRHNDVTRLHTQHKRNDSLYRICTPQALTQELQTSEYT